MHLCAAFARVYTLELSSALHYSIKSGSNTEPEARPANLSNLPASSPRSAGFLAPVAMHGWTENLLVLLILDCSVHLNLSINIYLLNIF